MTTLINDEFDETPKITKIISGVPVLDVKHRIVYGFDGHTDALDDETIGVLLEAGIISAQAVVDHGNGRTVLYVSRVGVCTYNSEVGE